MYEKFICVNDISKYEYLLSPNLGWGTVFCILHALALLLLLTTLEGEEHSTHFTAWVTCPSHRIAKWPSQDSNPVSVTAEARFLSNRVLPSPLWNVLNRFCCETWMGVAGQSGGEYASWKVDGRPSFRGHSDKCSARRA